MKAVLSALGLMLLGSAYAGFAQTPGASTISPSQPVPTGLAPPMQVKLVKDTPQGKVYAVIFLKGDEALSGLTDFAIR